MSKSKFDKILGLSLGLEDGDVTTTGDEEVLDGSETVEGEMLEVTDAAGEVEEAADTVEDLEETHENLEEIADGLAEASAEGGMSVESAKWARLAVKAAIGRSNIRMVDLAVPSMESFSGSSSSRRATMSMEGAVGEMLKAFWKAITDQVKKVWAYVKNWYLKVLDAAPKLKKRAQAIAKRASDISGAPEEKDFELSVLSGMHINGKVPSPSDARAKSKVLAEALNEHLGGKTDGAYDAMVTKMEEQVEHIEKESWDQASLEAYSTESNKKRNTNPANLRAGHAAAAAAANTAALSQQNSLGANTKTPSTRFGEDAVVQIGDELFGGMAFVVCTVDPAKKDEVSLLRQAKIVIPKLTNFAEKIRTVDANGSFKTLNANDIEFLTDQVIDICDSVISYRKSWEKRDATTKSMESKGDKYIAALERDKEAPAIKVKKSKDAVAAMMVAAQGPISFNTTAINYGLNTSRSLLTWCERSTAQYKGN